MQRFRFGSDRIMDFKAGGLLNPSARRYQTPLCPLPDPFSLEGWFYQEITQRENRFQELAEQLVNKPTCGSILVEL